MMSRARMITCLALALSMASACSFEGALRDQFYQPTRQAGGEIPLKVALIVDDIEQARIIRNQLDQTFKFEIKVNPGLTNGLAAELATVFKEVVVVKDVKQAADADLLAYASFRAIEDNPYIYSCSIDLKFQDPQSRLAVAGYQYADLVKTGTSGNYIAGAVLTAITLGLGAPIFLPMAVNSQGELMVEAFEAKLPAMISRVTNDIGKDERIAAFAAGTRPGQPAVAVAPKTPAIRSDVDRMPTGKAAVKKNAYAVVIGIESYRQALPKADFAAHDAKIVSDYLTKVMGYPEENVVTRLNDKAAKTDLEKYLEEWLPSRVRSGDSVFVYYSGHGAPNPKSSEPYLVPYDGDPAFVESTTFPLKRLYAALDKLPAKEIVVMLDSCFSGAGGRSVIAKGMRPMGLSIENPVLASGRTMVLAASSGTQVSSTFLEQGHGLLTYFFLKGLQGEGDINKDGTITMPELYEYVRPNVERVARNQYNNEQTPQLLASPDILKRGGGRLLEKAKP